MTLAPGRADVVGRELLGGDAFGVGDQPALSWRLPEGATRQIAYRIVTDDGYDSGRIESAQQSLVTVPLFDRSRRWSQAWVQVWTDLGESPLSEPVELASGLLSNDDWWADWIGIDEPEIAPKGSRPAYWLRAEFEGSAGVRTIVHVTALGLYEVWLNGRRVGDEVLAPGFTDYLQRVPAAMHDVTDLVHEGTNVIAVLLADGWYRGQVGMPRTADQFGPLTAVRLQVETVDGAHVLGTDESWRTAPSHITAADLIGGQREDRRLWSSAVHTAGFASQEWSPAVLRQAQAIRIVRPVAPPVRRVQELPSASVRRLSHDTHLVDLGQNINGWVRLARLGPEGTRITLRHGEWRDAEGDLTTAHLDVNVPIFPEPLAVGQVDEVISAGVDGDVFEPSLTTHGFQYVRIEGLADDLTVDDVVGVAVHSDLRRIGWFECSNERVNRLHEATVWSMRDNICSIPTDCPQRERSGWTGDWQIFAPTAAYLYDVLGFTRSWLRDLALAQHVDGRVTNQVPSPPAEGFHGFLGRLNGSAGWGDVIVSTPWDLYEAYADHSLLAEFWEPMCRWVDFGARTAAERRHPDREAARPVALDHERYLWDAGFHWGEWLEPGFVLTDFRAFEEADKSEVATAYLHRSAVTLASIGRVIGADAAAIERYEAIAVGARAAWQAEFIGPDGSLVVQSQASHVRALAFGLVPDELRAATADRLVALIREAGTHLGTGFLSTGLLLPTLAAAGHIDVAYALLLQDTEPSWLTMIDRGATTVWEAWNGVDADGVPHESLNHYSKGAVVSFLHRNTAGLVPTAPGYRTFRVQPQPGGDLTWARAALESPQGRIEVAWSTESGAFVLDVAVPAGTSAHVVLPSGVTHEVGPGRYSWIDDSWIDDTWIDDSPSGGDS